MTIRSRYEEAECSDCGATVTIDLDTEGPLEVSAPEDHNDDCPRGDAAFAEKRMQRTGPLSVQKEAWL